MSQQNPRFLIIGTGAIGGFYGGRLADAGYDVHFLARSDYAQIAKLGLRVDSPLGNIHLQSPSVFSNIDSMPEGDIALLCTKTGVKGELITKVAQKLSAHGIIIAMQNGLDVEEAYRPYALGKEVAAGLCFVCSNKSEPAYIRHLDEGAVVFAHRPDLLDGPEKELILKLVECFKKAKIPTSLKDSIDYARWLKLAWNIPFNGLSALLNATTEEIVKNPHTRALAHELITEVCAIAAACGITLPPNTPLDRIEITDRMVAYKTSMLLDLERKKPLELEFMFKRPLQKARDHGVSAPHIETLYQALEFRQAQYLK